MVAYAKPCGRCGWKFKTFHICLDRPLHIMRRVEEAPKKRKRNRPERDPNLSVRGSDEWRARVARGRQAHFDRLREVHQERDEMIVERYSEDEHSMSEIADEFRLPLSTVSHILHRAAEAGDVILRQTTQRVRS
jgi:DNA-directed RNA polymerase specialized sigma24 family protein